MVTNLICDECGGRMHEGFVPDNAYLAILRSAWIMGKPEKSFLLGINTSRKQAFYITAYRCENCGFLKFFAGPDDKK